MSFRTVRSMLVVLTILAASLPLGGCLGFLLGYAMGTAEGHAQEVYVEGRMDQVERLVCEATLSDGPNRRRAALVRLRREYLTPTDGDPASIRARADLRIVRLVETLDDPEPSVAAAGRLLLTEMVGSSVGIAHDDRLALEAMRDAGQHTPPDPATTAAYAAAHERACSAALRAYAMARLGKDLRDAAPLLRLGIGFPVAPMRNVTSSLSVDCALALGAATGEFEPGIAVLLEGTRRLDAEVRQHRTADWLFGGWKTETRVVMDTAVASVIGLGRAGTAATSALPTLRKIAAVEDDLVMRRAAETAIALIERGVAALSPSAEGRLDPVAKGP